MQRLQKESYLLELIALPTLQTVKQYELKNYKREAWPLIKFDEKDELAFRMLSEYLIEVLDLKTLEVLHQIQLKDVIDHFYLSPKSDNLMIACVLDEVTAHLKAFLTPFQSTSSGSPTA